MAAENYHLKWDSHISYLNSSVATLYKNEKFADVVLYSSNSSHHGNSDIPTVGISAHKFILSSCSQFFAAMFEMSPITSSNGVLYIVLPPELSHRAIQILVQYMYSGEATVSNDILNEVLRGGEILKIRGLCRSSSSSATTSSTSAHHSSHHSNLHGHHHHQQSSQQQREVCSTTLYSSSAHVSRAAVTLPALELYGNKTSVSSSAVAATSTNRYAIEHTTAHQFRGIGASLMPKDSPVIVKSPKLTHASLISTSKHGITVNKEVAIDPEDKCCYTGPPPPQPPSVQQDTLPPPPPPPLTMCTEVGCSSCPMSVASSATIAEVESMRRRQRMSSRSDERLYDERPPDDPRDEMGIIYERRVTVRDYYAPEHYDQPKSYVESSVARLATPPHPHNFLAIKQEPSDWSNSAPTTNENSSDDMQLPTHSQRHTHTPLSMHAHSPKQPLDFKMPINSTAVKLETNSSAEDSNDKIHDYTNYKMLVCELCQQSFEDTKTLVRHLETHDMGGGVSSGGASCSSTVNMPTTSNGVIDSSSVHKSYVPKKRRRISQQENNVDHVTLLCDLCSTSFETPAEWVRHMSNQHTEIELALFNSKKDGEQKNNNNNNNNNHNNNNSNVATTSQQQQQSLTVQQQSQQQHLPTTHKKYASRQSLMLHKHQQQRNNSNNNNNSCNNNSTKTTTTNNSNNNEISDGSSSNLSTSLTSNDGNVANNLQCDQLTATTSLT